MIDETTDTQTLVGPADKRAVSAVTGIVLAITATVLVAAALSTLVLDLGQTDDPFENATVEVHGNGSDELTVTVSNLDDAEGIALVDADGQVTASAQHRSYINETNQTATYTEAGTYTIYAFEGTVADGEDIEAATSRSSTIGEVTIRSE